MNNIIFKIYRKKTIKKVEDKVRHLGIYSTMDTIKFLNTRLLLSIIIFIFVLVYSKYGYILAPLITGLFYYLFEYIVLDYKIKKRGKKLEKEALFFLEVLALTLESGRNLKHSLKLTSNNINSEISEEFKKTLEEVNLGKSLNESLESMKKRIPSDSINNAILNMMQANSFGSSILDSMYNEIEFLRDKQMLEVKAEIAKLPTKVSIISVIFFIPIMMLIILAPVLINYIMK